MDIDKLNALEGRVEEIDSEGPPTPEAQAARKAAEEQAQQQDELETLAKAWARLPFMAGGMLVPRMPELAPVYSEPPCLSFGRYAATVAQKHGWGLPEDAPEIMLGLSILGFAIPTAMAIKARAAAAAPAHQSAPATPAGDLAPGAALAPEAAQVQAMATTGVEHGG